MRPTKSRSWFTRFAKGTARASGRPAAFIMATAIIVIWGITGPLFGFSDTWQLVINTGTTVVTFLMVFLIQKTQNKDGIAIQIKLNELVAALSTASNRVLSVEDLSEEQLTKLNQYYTDLAEMTRKEKQKKASHSIEDTDIFKEDKKDNK